MPRSCHAASIQMSPHVRAKSLRFEKHRLDWVDEFSLSRVLDMNRQKARLINAQIFTHGIPGETFEKNSWVEKWFWRGKMWAVKSRGEERKSSRGHIKEWRWRKEECQRGNVMLMSGKSGWRRKNRDEKRCGRQAWPRFSLKPLLTSLATNSF